VTREEKEQRMRWRRAGVAIILLCCVVAGSVYGLYWYRSARFRQVTDDAYVAGNIVAITARENATVTALMADNTQAVRQGQALVAFDPAMARIAMAAAEANLARVVRSVRGAIAGADSHQAQLVQAQAQLARARNDAERRQSALPGALSREEVAHARDEVTAAEAAVNAARNTLLQSRAAVAGTDIAENPDVLSAAAQLRAAAVTLSHMQLVAPVDGVVAQRTVQVGQRVNAGMPLMAVIPLANVWIDANFKEVQLADMRIGQPVTVTADIYGGKVVYHGRIQGLGAGSGNSFALLPPQNASGNWIKIVQRVPVRIALDPKELQDHPLRVGLSVAVDADVRDSSGPLVTHKVGAGTTIANTGEDSGPVADAMIARILKENGAAR